MVECEACSGKGLDPTDYHKHCEVCKGSGKVVRNDKVEEKPEEKAEDKPKETPKK